MSFIDFSDKPDGNYEYIMILQDEDTKFIILKALTSLESDELYNCLIEVFCLLGVPGTIITHEKSKIEQILQEFSYFNRNFDSKVDLPENEDDDDLEIQQLKNLVEDWMDRNNTNKWHNGLYFIQFQNNCTYNKSIRGSPFDMLLKPNYEYVKASYTRYLLHKPEIIDKSDPNNNNIKRSSTKSGLLQSKNKVERENDDTDEFYLAIEPTSNEDLNHEDIENLIQILDKPKTGRQSLETDKDVGAIDNKRVVVYKRNSKLQGPTPNAVVKLEPVNIEKSNNQMNWICKVREIDFVDSTAFRGSRSSGKKSNEWTNKESELGNSQDQLHVLELSSPTIEYADPPIRARSFQEHNSLVKTIRNELRKAPLDTPTTICLVCRKKKRTPGMLTNVRIGKPVRLRTSIIDRRQKGYPNYILAVIVDITPDGQYRLGTPKGILKDTYPSHALMDCNHTVFTIHDVPKYKFIDFTEAIQAQMKSSEKELIKCTCIRQYGYCNPKFSYHNQCLVHKKYTEQFRT